MDAQELIQQPHIWRAKDLAHAQPACLPSGYGQLDQTLGGGWPAAGMVEISYGVAGIGELGLLLPLLAKQHQQTASEQRLQMLINPPQGIQGQALVQAGLDLQRILIVRCANPQEALWAAEQSLQSGCCQQVVLWGRHMRVSEAKRLQCTAKDNDALLFWLREANPSEEALPISARLQIMPSPHGLQLRVVKLQGQWPQADTYIDMFQQWPHLYSQPASHNTNHNVVPIR